MELIFKLIEDDLRTYRPHTTVQEINELVKTSMHMSSDKINIVKSIRKTNSSFLSIYDLQKFISMNSFNKKGLLLRPLYKGAPIHHDIPSDFDVFYETSNDIYENYMRTLSNIGGTDFNVDDIESCIKFIDAHEYLLVWSNTSILVNKLMFEHKLGYKKIIAYGGPVLIARRDNLNPLNIYHEHDWILGMINMIYNIDMRKLDMNVIHEIEIDNNIVEVIILSHDLFPDKEIYPHRQYHHFLLAQPPVEGVS